MPPAKDQIQLIIAIWTYFQQLSTYWEENGRKQEKMQISVNTSQYVLTLEKRGV